MRLPSLAGMCSEAMGVVCGVVVVMLDVVTIVVVMPVAGLCRDVSGQKNGGRCE
jgi:hypothetical protein